MQIASFKFGAKAIELPEPVITTTRAPRDESILSPSQIEAFDCERKGAFKYLLKLPDPGNQDTITGSKVHKILENWLARGISPDDASFEGHIAMAMIKHLPVPKSPGVLVEGEFTFEDRGVQYTGTKDLEYWKDYEHRKGLIVHDHKTCGSFKYIKTPEVLRTDVQAVLYAQHAFQKYPDIGELEENWLYATKSKDPQTRKVHLTVYRDAVDEEAAKIAVRAKEIIAIKQGIVRTAQAINELPPNLEICPKYRGCPYKGVCNLSPTARVLGTLKRNTTKETTMNFADMQKKLQATKLASATPATPPAPPPAPPGGTIREKLAIAPAQGINPPDVGLVAREKLAIAPAQGINPPDVGLVVTANPSPASAGAAVVASVAHSLEGEAPKAPEPVKRKGRPVGSKNRPKEDAVVEAEESTRPTDPAPAPAEPEADEPPPVETAQCFLLCVNCYPVVTKHEVIELGKLLDPVQKALCAQAGVPHYTAIEYGKGPGLLAFALESFLEQNPLNESQAVVLDTRTQEGAACLNVLTRYATAVMRGF